MLAVFFAFTDIFDKKFDYIFYFSRKFCYQRKNSCNCWRSKLINIVNSIVQAMKRLNTLTTEKTTGTKAMKVSIDHWSNRLKYRSVRLDVYRCAFLRTKLHWYLKGATLSLRGRICTIKWPGVRRKSHHRHALLWLLVFDNNEIIQVWNAKLPVQHQMHDIFANYCAILCEKIPSIFVETAENGLSTWSGVG